MLDKESELQILSASLLQKNWQLNWKPYFTDKLTVTWTDYKNCVVFSRKAIKRMTTSNTCDNKS